MKLYGSQSSSKFSIFQTKKPVFLEIMDLCLNFGIGFCLSDFIKKLVCKNQFQINHARHVKFLNFNFFKQNSSICVIQEAKIMYLRRMGGLHNLNWQNKSVSNPACQLHLFSLNIEAKNPFAHQRRFFENSTDFFFFSTTNYLPYRKFSKKFIIGISRWWDYFGHDIGNIQQK